MAALPNVSMSQSTPRPASPAAAGLAVTSDGTPQEQGQNFSSGQSFAETILNKSSAQPTLDTPPTGPQSRQVQSVEIDAVQSLSLTDIDFPEINAELSASDLNTQAESLVTLDADDVDSAVDTPLDIKTKIDDAIITDVQAPSSTLSLTSGDLPATFKDSPITQTVTYDSAPNLESGLGSKIAVEAPTTAILDTHVSTPRTTDITNETFFSDAPDVTTGSTILTTNSAEQRVETLEGQKALAQKSFESPDLNEIQIASSGRTIVSAAAATELPTLATGFETSVKTPNLVTEGSNIRPQITNASATSADIATPSPVSTNIPANSISTQQTLDAQTSSLATPEVQTMHTAVETDTALTKTEVSTATSIVPSPQDDIANTQSDVSDRPRLSERAADTAEYRAVTKVQTPAPELAKISDAPSNLMIQFASNDGPTVLKSTPVFTMTPTLTPIASMSDRLAGTILQTTNAQPVVTMDKLPQAVVAIALSAKSATLQIDPPELGRIQLDYQFDTQGRTIVTLTPESDAARAALMDRMAVITAALEQGSSSPIDVQLGDARDFGSEFGNASHDNDGSGSGAGADESHNSANENSLHNKDLQRFTRAPAGEPDRLHILV